MKSHAKNILIEYANPVVNEAWHTNQTAVYHERCVLLEGYRLGRAAAVANLLVTEMTPSRLGAIKRQNQNPQQRSHCAEQYRELRRSLRDPPSEAGWRAAMCHT